MSTRIGGTSMVGRGKIKRKEKCDQAFNYKNKKSSITYKSKSEAR